MSSSETHLEKYRMFKADANNEGNSIPTRIEAYFHAAFHLIEVHAAISGIHIEKHQKVRTILEWMFPLNINNFGISDIICIGIKGGNSYNCYRYS